MHVEDLGGLGEVEGEVDPIWGSSSHPKQGHADHLEMR